MTQKHILLVEDDRIVAFLMREHLAAINPSYHVVSVYSGEDALEQIKLQSWDLVITDNRMAGITGLQLIERLRKESPATLTILMTAYTSDEVKQAARHLNVFRFMTKPFPLADLGAVIQEAFSSGLVKSAA